MSEQIDRNVAANSVVLIGPAGVGKSTIARELSAAKNMPVVTLDLLRHCPSSVEEIEKRKANFEAQIEVIKETINAGSQERLSDELIKEYGHLKNGVSDCEELMRLRKMFPNVPNYEQMGFKGEVSRLLDDNFGKVAWHFYQKQFENRLLKAVMEQATEPFIFDLGGGMAVSLDRDYVNLAKKFKELNAEEFEKNFNLSEIGFSHIQNILGQFSHVISLELPKDYAYRDTRSAKDELNPVFMSTGQYDELATDERHKINVGNLVLIRGGINKDRLTEIVETITSLTQKTIVRK